MANDPIACSRAISDYAYERANVAELEGYAATSRSLGAEPEPTVQMDRARSLVAAAKHERDVAILCGRTSLRKVDDTSWALGQARGSQRAYTEQAGRLPPGSSYESRTFLNMARDLDAVIARHRDAQFEAQGSANPLADR